MTNYARSSFHCVCAAILVTVVYFWTAPQAYASSPNCYFGECPDAVPARERSNLATVRLGRNLGFLEGYSKFAGCIQQTIQQFPDQRTQMLSAVNTFQRLLTTDRLQEIFQGSANLAGLKHERELVDGLFTFNGGMILVDDLRKRNLVRYYARQLPTVNDRDHLEAGMMVTEAGWLHDYYNYFTGLPYGNQPQRQYQIGQFFSDCIGRAYGPISERLRRRLTSLNYTSSAAAVPQLRRWILGPRRRPPPTFSMQNNFLPQWEAAVRSNDQ